ncbi:hypothetical protein P2318_15465 [Myxococcaceae bacterium GXIMD 01537]
MTRRLIPGLLALLCLAGGCKSRPKEDKPIAGLLAAGAPVRLLVERKEPKPIAVGAKLLSGDRIEATGPAVLEYFGGGLRFLEKGDEFEVGDVQEARLFGSNVPSYRWVDGDIQEAPPAQRIIAARYTNIEVTPASAFTDREPGTGELLLAFFSPDGFASLNGGPRPEGPSSGLPPPPLRPKVPIIHAGALGEGGFVAEVTDGFAVAETDDLATALLTEDKTVALGRTVRLLVPKGAEVELKSPTGQTVEVEGPADLRLR